VDAYRRLHLLADQLVPAAILHRVAIPEIERGADLLMPATFAEVDGLPLETLAAAVSWLLGRRHGLHGLFVWGGIRTRRPTADAKGKERNEGRSQYNGAHARRLCNRAAAPRCASHARRLLDVRPSAAR